MRILLALVVAFVAASVARVLGFGMGFYGLFANLIWLVVFIAVFLLMKRRSGAAPPRVPEGFSAAFAHDNIAIDTGAGKLWLRDGSGATAVVDKGDVLRWSTVFVSRGTIHTRNRLEVHVRDLARPKFEVPFRRHSDMNKFGAARNYAEAEEWNSRLTTWVNNT